MAALLLGLATTWLLEPAGFKVVPGINASLSAEWVSVLMWPRLAGQDLLKLATIGLPGAVTLALVMILETFTATAIMEARFGVRTNAHRELVALGGANIGSALLGGSPCTGSPLRSVASWVEGGRGATAALLCAAITTALIAVLGHWLVALPASLMAGLFMIQAMMMLDPAFVQRLRAMLARRQSQRNNRDSDDARWLDECRNGWNGNSDRGRACEVRQR